MRRQIKAMLVGSAVVLAATCVTSKGQAALLPAVSNYYAAVSTALFTVWKQRPDLPPNLKTYWDVRVDRVGKLRSVVLVRSSGNKAMDDSVERTLRSNPEFPSMPKEMTNRTEVLHLCFETETAATPGMNSSNNAPHFTSLQRRK